jgi:hypothetical protein
MSTSVPVKRLRLRRADVCVVCDRQIEAGVEALWHRGPRVVTCLGCNLGGETVLAGEAGTSALREYERRQQRREDYAREKLGGLGVALARVIDPPTTTQAWKRGGEGERRVGARLEKLLAGSEVRLLHDRLVPGAGRRNIDHIAIGPGGVTVIDTKNYRGKVRVQRVGGLFSPQRTILSIKGRDQTKLVTGVESQVELLQTALATAGDGEEEVRGALCFANVDGLPLLGHPSLHGILIDGARASAKLARRPGPMSAERVEQLWALIGKAFPSA